MVKVIVVGTHKYEWAIWPFAALFHKYWDDKAVTYIGDRQPASLPDNVEYMHVPCYSKSRGAWSWKYWFGTGLISIMKYYSEQQVLMFLPDHWLRAPVDVGYIESLAWYMGCDDSIVRGNLTAGVGLYTYGSVIYEGNGYEIWSKRPDHGPAGLDGGMAFRPSVWNPGRVADLIKPWWTLWECERLGTDMMMDRPYLRAIGIHPPPIHIATDVLRHDCPNVVNLHGLSGGDKDIVMPYIPSGWSVE